VVVVLCGGDRKDVEGQDLQEQEQERR
jgi:hypothetical protein